MIFFHLSDLHIGKQLHRYSLKEDQTAVLQEVVQYAASMHPDAIVIAGDIYDKPVPAAEAVSVFDMFLTGLTKIHPAIPVLIISGNHDSPERLSYAGSILTRSQVYIAGKLPETKEEKLKCITLHDSFGKVNFYLLPFLKPGYVRHLFHENPPSGYQEAVQAVLEREKIDWDSRNVLVSHQFYTGNGKEAETCDSEVFSIGGIDNIDSRLVERFDYAALGHLHGAQKAGAGHIRYCGTLLKYSVSEAHHTKGLTVVELSRKGSAPQVRVLPLSPVRDVRKVKGTLGEILSHAEPGEDGGKPENPDDYISITLTDEVEPYKVRERLREVFSHVLEVRMENQKIKEILEETDGEALETDPFSLFSGFYREIHGKEMTAAEKDLLLSVIDERKEEK